MRISFDPERFISKPNVWLNRRFGSKDAVDTVEDFQEEELTVSLHHVTLTMTVADWKRLMAAVRAEIRKAETELACPWPVKTAQEQGA